MIDYLTIRNLCHSGIKGQKWGIRRYQNYDGTLTEEGKVRYGVDKDTGNMSKEGARLYSKDKEEAVKKSATVGNEVSKMANAANQAIPGRGSKVVNKNKQNYSKMSDEELKKKVNRLSLERQYADLSGDNKYVMSGKDWLREALQTIGAVAAIGASAATIYSLFKKG